jgi:hypothetical protein
MSLSLRFCRRRFATSTRGSQKYQSYKTRTTSNLNRSKRSTGRPLLSRRGLRLKRLLRCLEKHMPKILPSIEIINSSIWKPSLEPYPYIIKEARLRSRKSWLPFGGFFSKVTKLILVSTKPYPLYRLLLKILLMTNHSRKSFWPMQKKMEMPRRIW